MIELDDEIWQAVNGAFQAQNPVVLGSVGDDGAPHLSYRGSTQVLGKDQLAVWVRNPDAGLPKAIRNHPRVTLLHSSVGAAAAAHLQRTRTHRAERQRHRSCKPAEGRPRSRSGEEGRRPHHRPGRSVWVRAVGTDQDDALLTVSSNRRPFSSFGGLRNRRLTCVLSVGSPRRDTVRRRARGRKSLQTSSRRSWMNR
jgi:pyridoxamine 5'-phosphate oxidase-like protein